MIGITAPIIRSILGSPWQSSRLYILLFTSITNSGRSFQEEKRKTSGEIGMFQFWISHCDSITSFSICLIIKPTFLKILNGTSDWEYFNMTSFQLLLVPLRGTEFEGDDSGPALLGIYISVDYCKGHNWFLSLKNLFPVYLCPTFAERSSELSMSGLFEYQWDLQELEATSWY